MSLDAGTKLGRYEIRSQLGAGGMGEVYLAQDTKLDRKVALKILPAEVAANQQRMRRFVQEAKAAAALNHPNIAHIYEIGESDGVNFIAMEFIDGQTLRELIHSRQTDLKKLLRYLQHVAEGLAKAHAAGIVHRDLKPANIMITRDGHAKVLDFGLAKVVEPQRPFDSTESGSSEIATAMMPQHSVPGMVMGTVGYMSPEQATGRVNEIDHRSDIFSFGCILFEVATGQKAFEGKDVLDSLHKIVHAPTPQIKDFDPNAPDDLQRIVRRCLAKEPEKRYQSIKEVAIELEELQQELKGADYSVQSTSAGRTALSGNAQTGLESARRSSTGMMQDGTARSTTSASIIFSEIKRNKRGVFVVLAALVVVMAGLAFGLYRLAGRKEVGSARSFASMKITKLTDTGKAGSVAISPDGKYVVHVMEDAGQQSLWVRHIATGSNVPIIPPAEVVYDRMTFSPDGSYIYFLKTEKSDLIRKLYQVPVLGGEPRKLILTVGSPITFSPDAKRFAFVRNQADESTIFIANADGTGEQKLATLKRPETFGDAGPAWSPDGKVIASGAVSYDGGRRQNIIVEVWLEDGAIKPIVGSQKWSGVERVAWLADGSGLIAACEEQGSTTHQVYQFSYPGGEARRITNDVNNYHDTSLTADSSAMVTVQENRVSNIWLAPDGDVSRARQLTYGSDKDDGATGLQWTPDAKIVYVSRVGGLRRIWIVNGDGSNQRQLTPHRSLKPAVSPDGHYIVFGSTRAGADSIWRMDIDGGNLKQLTTGKFDSSPCISPDGRWVVYTSSSSGETRLWRVSIDGGEPVRLTDNYSRLPVVSPDGKRIACHYREQQNSQWRIAIIPFEGGPPTKLLDIASEIRIANRDNPSLQVVRWLPDGRSLGYIVTREGVSNIWSLPVDGGPPKQLTNFTSDQIFSFDLARDGKPNLFARGATTKDVVLISGFRQ